MDVKSLDMDQEYRDRIATVDEDGRRNWIYPKKPKGPFYEYRKYVSYVLLLFLFGMPFVKVNGEPLLLFNVLERKFILFGVYFAPQDFHLFVFAMLIFIIFIALFTVIYGRLFCGWVCPQTIFMEMVFRRIEYWIEGDANAQRRLKKAPWTADKLIKKVGKQMIFFTIAVLVANTFLAYIIGLDEVVRIATEPVSENFGGFTSMILFSGAFYFVFSYLREQVCTTICPYGRLQGVLLDKNSIVVAYDYERGEPRGKIRKAKKTKTLAVEGIPAKEDPIAAIQQQLGDCIDCKLCVQVCPTGIDIRDGTQLECVNCTACIDACDEVMVKVNRPKGLIRYDSENGIATGKKKIFTTRVIAYSVVLGILLIVQGFLFTARTDVEALLLRTPGMLFQKVDEENISNLYNYQIINKTQETFPIEFKLVSDYGGIRMIGQPPQAKESGVTEGALFIDMPTAELTGRKTRVKVEVYSGDKLIDVISTTFLGPVK
ncbi:MAG: cytochrome c oxidase accessory protein CcoG [Saprospiraceae bacterium]|nr:cytochrome c oxidase accessory protein CcoG [Saprospiraceae bacterium]